MTILFEGVAFMPPGLKVFMKSFTELAEIYVDEVGCR
jgi:hypothetical protein